MSRLCESWTRRTKRQWPEVSTDMHPCTYPAKFRIRARSEYGGNDVDPNVVSWQGEYVCGIHVRPALMDNGDSVWKPWIIERLEEVTA